MNLQAAELPVKKKRKKTAKNSSSRRTTLSFSLLPDEIIVNCLARVPRSCYPKLSLVSKSFRSLLSSTELYAARSSIGRTQKYFYVCLWSSAARNPNLFQWISLSINPSRTKKIKKTSTIGQLSVPILSPSFATAAKPAVVGFEIYVIGSCCNEPSSTVRVLNCYIHTWRDAPSMNVPRCNPVSCVYDGKIYVFGGINKRLLVGELWGEVFDIKTQTWESLPQPGCEICKDYPYIIKIFEGKIYFWNGDAMYAYYDPKQCKWGKGATLPLPECVIDNVSYSFRKHGDRFNLWWRDINGNESKEVQGLDSFIKRYKKQGGSVETMPETVSCGGKLYVMWKLYMRKHKILKIWCAQISLEKRDRDEIWGSIEWFDVVHTANKPCHLWHCSEVSL